MHKVIPEHRLGDPPDTVARSKRALFRYLCSSKSHDAVVPRARERQKGSVGSSVADEYRYSGLLARHLFRGIRIHARAENDELNDADSLSARCCLRSQTRLDWRTYAADPRGRAIDWIRGAIATIYAAGMIYAGGAKFLLLSALLYAPGTALFIIARCEQRKTVSTLVEWVLFGAILVAAAVGLYSLAAGTISI